MVAGAGFRHYLPPSRDRVGRIQASEVTGSRGRLPVIAGTARICESQPHSDTSLLAGTLRGRRPGDLLPGNEAELVAGRALNELRDFKLEP